MRRDRRAGEVPVGRGECDAFPIGWRRQLLYEHFYLSVAVLLKPCVPIVCVRLLSLPRFKASHPWRIYSLPRFKASLLLYQVSIPQTMNKICRAISMIIHLAGIRRY